MAMTNSEIAAVLDEIGELLELTGANPFRARAYHNAGMTVRDYGPDIVAIVGSGGELPKLPNIGPDLSGKISEIVRTGSAAMLERLRREVPPGLLELLRLPHLGPKRVKLLWENLNILTAADLKAACERGEVQKIRGIGPKLEQQLLQALSQPDRESGSRRHLLADVEPLAKHLLEELAAVPGVEQAAVAGSFRRGLETVGDLDLLATARNQAAVMRRFLAHREIVEVLASGTTRASVRLRNGLQVDLRIVPRVSFGAALYYFTGSKEHNIALRQLGQKRGLKINEYGVFEGEKRIAGKTEESVLATVGLPFIPPELRENRGEFEAARSGTLPRLIAREDLKGDLHCHTTASDGRNSLSEMVTAAQARGLSYLAITEHTKTLALAHGLDERRLQERLDEIDALNAKLRNFTVLKAAEVDILENGELDYPDSLLRKLDIVVASVHSRFGETREKQTGRLKRALDNRFITILGHPTGRRIPRPPYEVNMEEVIEHAKQRGCALELNSQPQRLDLNDHYATVARELGVPISIDSDAHSTAELDNVRYGILQARRAWIEPAHVINAQPLDALRRFVAATRA